MQIHNITDRISG